MERPCWGNTPNIINLDSAQRMVYWSEIGDRRIDPVEYGVWCRACDAVYTVSYPSNPRLIVGNGSVGFA